MYLSIGDGPFLTDLQSPHFLYDVGYRVEHGSYSGVSSANYTDQALSANANWVFSGRAGLKLGAEYMLGHDDQGAVPGAATHANPDKYHQTSFNALAGYGAEGAQGRVDVDGGVINKRYDNFELTAAGLPRRNLLLARGAQDSVAVSGRADEI